jgi:hypothetical protein
MFIDEMNHTKSTQLGIVNEMNYMDEIDDTNE